MRYTCHSRKSRPNHHPRTCPSQLSRPSRRRAASVTPCPPDHRPSTVLCYTCPATRPRVSVAAVTPPKAAPGERRDTSRAVRGGLPVCSTLYHTHPLVCHTPHSNSTRMPATQERSATARGLPNLAISAATHSKRVPGSKGRPNLFGRSGRLRAHVSPNMQCVQACPYGSLPYVPRALGLSATRWRRPDDRQRRMAAAFSSHGPPPRKRGRRQRHCCAVGPKPCRLSYPIRDAVVQPDTHSPLFRRSSLPRSLQSDSELAPHRSPGRIN